MVATATAAAAMVVIDVLSHAHSFFCQIIST